MLFCGDLFAHIGNTEPLTSGSIVEQAIAAEDMFQATSVGSLTSPTIRQLAALEPHRLALMHGSSFEGDGAKELLRLADYYEAKLRAAS